MWVETYNVLGPAPGDRAVLYSEPKSSNDLQHSTLAHTGLDM